MAIEVKEIELITISESQQEEKILEEKLVSGTAEHFRCIYKKQWGHISYFQYTKMTSNLKAGSYESRCLIYNEVCTYEILTTQPLMNFLAISIL